MPDHPHDSRRRRRQSVTPTGAGGAPFELTLRVLQHVVRSWSAGPSTTTNAGQSRDVLDDGDGPGQLVLALTYRAQVRAHDVPKRTRRLVLHVMGEVRAVPDDNVFVADRFSVHKSG